MIVDLIVGVLFGILNAVLGLVPSFEVTDWTVAAGIRTAGGGLDLPWVVHTRGWLWVWNHFVPVRFALSCLLLLLAAKLFSAVVQLVMWFWDRIPFKSS